MTDRALRMLYRDVPAVVGCKPGCGRCCGPVPWSPAERARVAPRLPDDVVAMPAPGPNDGFLLLVRESHPTRCAALDDDKRCTVYDARPLMCRLFGATDAPQLTCAFGARAARPLTDTKARALCNRYVAQERA